MGRQLSTAAAVLQALRLVQEQDSGITATELGASLGRSAATARYLLNSLRAEGFAERGPQGRWRPVAPVVGNPYSASVAELHRRTRRCAVAWRAAAPTVEVLALRTHQGLPGFPCAAPGECGLALRTATLTAGRLVVHEHDGRVVVGLGTRVPGTAIGVVASARLWHDDRDALLEALTDAISGPDADVDRRPVASGAHSGGG